MFDSINILLLFGYKTKPFGTSGLKSFSHVFFTKPYLEKRRT